MKTGTSRRGFLASLPATVALPSLAATAQAMSSRDGIKIGMVLRDLSEAHLRFFRQIGVEWVATMSPQMSVASATATRITGPAARSAREFTAQA